MKAIVERVIRETEKAIFALVAESTEGKIAGTDGCYYVASKEMWLPKSVVSSENVVAEWFCKKNGNFGWV